MGKQAAAGFIFPSTNPASLKEAGFFILDRLLGYP
jgi:hypothetical protein